MKQLIVVLIILSLFGLTFCHRRLNDQSNGKHNNHNNKNKHGESKVKYLKAAIPVKIFNCMNKLSLMRCMKLLMLARMESKDLQKYNTGNATIDFLNQIIESDDENIPYNYHEVYANSNDTVVNVRLLKAFQKFFENRAITLHFIPGMIVKVVPSQKNMLEFSIKDMKTNQDDSRQFRDDGGKDVLIGGGNKGGLLKKKKGYGQYVQIGAPFAVFPFVLLGSVLPFILPALKMATVFAGVVNNAALLAGILYLARQHAIQNEHKNTIYFNPGYSRNGLKKRADIIRRKK